MAWFKTEKRAVDVAMEGSKRQAEALRRAGRGGAAAPALLIYQNIGPEAAKGNEIDDDWELLAQLAKSKTRFHGWKKRFPFGERTLDIYEGEGVKGDALELFPGAALELKAFKGTIHGADDQATLTGEGGMLVVAPLGSENTVVTSVQTLALAANGLAFGIAEKKEGREMVFHELGKRYLSTSKIELRGKSLLIQEGTQYIEDTMEKQVVSGVEITAEGFSQGMAIPVPEAPPLPESTDADLPPSPVFLMPMCGVKVEGELQIQAMLDTKRMFPQEGSRGVENFSYEEVPLKAWLFKQRGKGFQVSRHEIQAEGLRRENGVLCADKFSFDLGTEIFNILDPRYNEEEKIWYATGRSAEEKPKEEAEEEEDDDDEEDKDKEDDISLIDILKDPKAAYEKGKEKLKEDAQEKVEEFGEKVELAKLAWKLSLEGKSQEEIGDALKEAGYEEEGEKQTHLFDFKWEPELISWPIIPPFLSLGLTFKTKGYLDKKFTPPSLSSPEGMQLSAALIGNASLGLRASVEAGVPYVFVAEGGIEADAILSGAGDKEEIIEAAIKAPMAYDKANQKINFLENPTARLTGGVKLIGKVIADVGLKSKIFSWEKELWSYELGSWEMASLTGEAVAEKGDRDLFHPFSNWSLKSTNLTGEAFGATLLSKYNESNQFGFEVKPEQLLAGAIEEKGKYEEALKRIQELKKAVSAGLVFQGSTDPKKASQFQGMLDHAKRLEEEFNTICQRSEARIELSLRDIEHYIATKEYRKVRDIQAERLSHERNQRILENTEEGTEDLREKTRKEITESSEFDKALRKKAKIQMFGQGAAKKYEEEKKQEASKDFLEKTNKVKELMRKYKIQEGNKGTFHAGFAADYWDNSTGFWKSRDKVKALARLYAEPEDMIQYEEGRKAAYNEKDQGQSQGRMEGVEKSGKEKGGQALKESYIKQSAGDFRWIVLGGVEGILRFEEQKIQKMKAEGQETSLWEKVKAKVTGKADQGAVIPADELYRSASTAELIQWEHSKANVRQMDAAEQAEAFNDWITMLQTSETGVRQPAKLEKNIKPFLSLEVLLDYEKDRLQVSKQKVKHESRIQALQAAIVNRDLTEDEKKKKEIEAEEIDKYFQGEKQAKKASGFLDSLRVSRGKRYQQLMEKGLDNYQDRFNQGNTALQFLLAAQTDSSMGEQERIRTYFREYANQKGEQEQISEFLAQSRKANVLDAGTLEAEALERYKDMKEGDLTLEKGAAYSHQEILERLSRLPKEPADAFVAVYLSMGGGEEYAKSAFCEIDLSHLDQLKSYDAARHGERWEKHNERLNLLKRMEGSPRREVVEKYEEMVQGDRTFMGENFFKEDTLKKFIYNRLTPARVEQEEEGRLAEVTADYDRRLAIIEKGMAAGISDEEREAQFDAYMNTQTRFGRGRIYGDSTEVDSLVDQWRNEGTHMGDSELLEYETKRAAECEREIERLNAPIKALNQAVDTLTEVMKNSQRQIDELELLQKDPNQFFANGMESQALEQVGEDYDRLEQASVEKPVPGLDVEKIIEEANKQKNEVLGNPAVQAAENEGGFIPAS